MPVMVAVLVACGDPTPTELLASAEGHLRDNDTQAALINIKTALQRDPHSSKARFLLGSTLLRLGDDAGAQTELEKASELLHPDTEVLPALAAAMLANGQARQMTERMAATRLEDPQAQARLDAHLAAAYAALGQLEESQSRVDAALKVEPKNDLARLLQARLVAGRGELDPALGLVKTLLVDSPRYREGWNLQGELLLAGSRDAAAAEAAFRKALEIEPRYLRVHLTLISMALARKDQEAFKQQVLALKKALPRHLETQFFEAQLALMEGDLKTASQLTRVLLPLAPQNVRVLQLAGSVELNQGALAAAEAHLKRALKIQPKLPTARRLLAQVYERTGRPAEAMATLKPLLEVPQPSAATLTAMGEAQLLAGQFAQAEDHFRRATERAPEDRRLQTALSVAQIASGKVDSGLAALETQAAADQGVSANLALISSRIRLKDLDRALTEVDSLQGKLPTGSPLPDHVRGRIMALRGDAAAARSHYEQALKNDPRHFPSVMALTQMDLAGKQHEAAIQRLNTYVKAEPANQRAFALLVDIHRQAGLPPAQILSLLQKAVKDSPSEAAPRLLLVDHLLRASEVKEAMAAAQDANLAIPEHPALLDALGRTQVAAGNLQQAERSLSKSAQMQPSSVEALLKLAAVQLQNKDSAAAVATLRKALAMDPESLPTQRGLMRLAIAENRGTDALLIAQAVQKLAPKAAEGHLLEAEVHASQKKWAQAAAAYRLALEREVSGATAIRLHAALQASGKPADAAAFAARWTKDQPKDAPFQMHLAYIALTAQKFDTAEQHFRAFLLLKPDDPVALNNLAWVLMQQRKPGALAYAEKANRLAPNTVQLMDTLALALAVDGQWPAAIEWQRKALALADEDAAQGLRLRLAKMLQQSGDVKGARRELEILEQLGPTFRAQPEVEFMLKSLG